MEGKNYHWSTFESEGVKLLIRQFRQHLTVYTNFDKKHMHEGKHLWTDSRYSAFTFHTNTKKITIDDVIEGIAYDIIPPSAVPVPSAVWLFGSGLLGLVGIARRRKSVS